ncbi:endonuclease/exonuclease/phosphatase family protein [Haloferula sp. BvORR071]|uniref:endonuclease/exonuclease/phosphatase family protein n=1 Tax=Haloferula sp. BvORR071 TaxID=1396141 RepID=UPI0006979C58|nr:endonuclease/exonuclease/phosphatase family protein [Haloferula sp. BvORR071]
MDTAPKSPDGRLHLTLASFNIKYEGDDLTGYRAWPTRMRGVLATIRGMNPDVIGVQEALHGQCADLWASMPDYAFYGAGRDDGKRAGEYAGIFYRRDRFERDITQQGIFWLSDTPEVPGSKTWGNDFPRVVTWTRLIDRASKKGLYVYNTHWDHRNQPSREKAAVLIAQRIEQRQFKDEPVVLLGDFNAGTDNAAVSYFTGGAVKLSGAAVKPLLSPLTDVFRVMLPPGGKSQQTLHLWRPLVEGWPRIDHILVSKGAKVEATGIQRVIKVEDRPSDHFPVWARVSWP